MHWWWSDKWINWGRNNEVRLRVKLHRIAKLKYESDVLIGIPKKILRTKNADELMKLGRRKTYGSLKRQGMNMQRRLLINYYIGHCQISL